MFASSVQNGFRTAGYVLFSSACVLSFLISPPVSAAASGYTTTADTLYIGQFSSAEADSKDGEARLPENWETMQFRGLDETRYRLVGHDGMTVIRAESEASSSGLIYRQDIDLKEFPIIEWRWKVDNILEKGDLREKDGDDYPARVYVLFDYDIKNLGWWTRNRIRAMRTFYGTIPTRAITYIHANQAETGTIAENPYTDLVSMMAVDSGRENLGEWQHFERNIYEDYIEIYGEEPPPIGGIAIMTDSDDTGESARAWFGDILFRSAVEEASENQ
jgi:hypothetical protein